MVGICNHIWQTWWQDEEAGKYRFNIRQEGESKHGGQRL